MNHSTPSPDQPTKLLLLLLLTITIIASTQATHPEEAISQRSFPNSQCQISQIKQIGWLP